MDGSTVEDELIAPPVAALRPLLALNVRWADSNTLLGVLRVAKHRTRGPATEGVAKHRLGFTAPRTADRGARALKHQSERVLRTTVGSDHMTLRRLVGFNQQVPTARVRSMHSNQSHCAAPQQTKVKRVGRVAHWLCFSTRAGYVRNPAQNSNKKLLAGDRTSPWGGMFACFYTKHLKRKRKVWNDGFLKLRPHGKVVLLSEDKEELDSKFLVNHTVREDEVTGAGSGRWWGCGTARAEDGVALSYGVCLVLTVALCRTGDSISVLLG